MNIKNAKIAREGFIYILVLALLAWVVAVLGLKIISILIAALTMFIIFFFRDPERVTPQDSFAVIAPADGEIIEIASAREADFLVKEMKKISIFLSLVDCHMNRSPLTGTIRGKKYTKGRFDFAYLNSSSHENERLSTLIESEDGEKIVVVQIAGFLARRIVSYLSDGSFIRRGERIGMIKFGSRVDTFLPQHSEIIMKVGEKVRGGETIIGWLRGG